MRFLALSALVFLSQSLFANCDKQYLACRLADTPGVTCNATTGGQICVLPPNMPGFSYSKEMAVLIPNNLRTPAKMVLGMHGIRGTCPLHNATTLNVALDWQATRQLPTDTVMVFPMSSGNTVTYKAELADRFAAFSSWANALTGAPANADWTIAAHSGSGTTIARILNRKPTNVRAALMLDAAYSVTSPTYAPMWRNAKTGRAKIYNVFTPNAGTSSNSAWLEREMGPQKIDNRASVTSDHCAVPRREIGSLIVESNAGTAGTLPTGGTTTTGQPSLTNPRRGIGDGPGFVIAPGVN